MESVTHSVIHSVTHSLTHSITHSLVHSFNQSHNSLIHSFSEWVSESVSQWVSQWVSEWVSQSVIQSTTVSFNASVISQPLLSQIKSINQSINQSILVLLMGSKDSSVSVVTRLRVGWPGVQFPARTGIFFFLPPRPDRFWGPHRLLYNGYWRKSGRGVKLNPHLHLASRLRMRTVIPSLSHTSSWHGN
jgi:hypothetical protein